MSACPRSGQRPECARSGPPNMRLSRTHSSLITRRRKLAGQNRTADPRAGRSDTRISTECRTAVRRCYESRGGTFEKRGPSPSAMVGCADRGPRQSHATLWVPQEWEGELRCLRSSNTTKCVFELANLQVSCRRSEQAFKTNAVAGLLQLTH